ncbi:putative bifunctional diguanylate cyclase/phosphodiesterase [Novosphingobium sp. 9]|uniref:putative bifunctional diguanylate cyclase/phosphodiesterase n=1 Tax=Novosphingobium sp. 9 TaxID=2025349 RepID=UPI0021B6C609|nr:EAL domain-containing protein [Novosphingobium sp. 9]
MKKNLVGNTTGIGTEAAKVDVVALGIVSASIMLFIATGVSVGPHVIDALAGRGQGPQNFMVDAFLLNVAILLFGWSRYRDLLKEVETHRAAENDARQIARTDALTGFLNRRTFAEVTASLLENAGRDDRIVVVMMIDLDNFKQVNDYHGHQTGDLLLQEIAARIASIVPAGAAVARVGGDEFALSMSLPENRLETADHVADQIVRAVGSGTMIRKLSLGVSASVGIARSDVASRARRNNPSEPIDPRSMLDMADIAMYHAKRNGRNGHYWFEASMADEMRMRGQLEAGIRDGIARGEFVPFYEQQIDLETGTLTGFEMLARWDSPSFGLVSPDLFIPIAEEIGAIGSLSESVIQQALEDAMGWDASLSLSVNISPLQLRDPWFAQKLMKMLAEANFPPQRLEIEITESCLHENIAQVRTLIASLKNQGVRVSLDDFGTGYSSLAQLRNLPFDRIKIDRSFVTNLTENEDNAAIVHAIALLGEGLNLPVTVEGIETGAILERLRQYRAIKGQGYLYGRPRPAKDLQEWLVKHGSSLPAATVAAIRPQLTLVDKPEPDKPTQTGKRQIGNR